jgi:hypothetical protein
VSSARWDGARPDEPQLPLYLAYGGLAEVSGVAFAQLRARKPKLIARAAHPDLVQAGRAAGKTPELPPAEREQWSAALASLAEDFLRGEAVLNPKRAGATCKYCGLQPLCRVQEVPVFEEESEADEEVEL